MDRQAVTRLILFAAIVSLVGLSAYSNQANVIALAIGVPAAFIAGGVFLLSLPFIAEQKAEGKSIGLRKLLDVAEHAGPLAWLDLFILWCTGFIAFMGYADGTMVYRTVFVALILVGLITALRDLFLSEEPDVEQEAWQEHPQDH